jgi:diacylglycerol kinase family enzyme
MAVVALVLGIGGWALVAWGAVDHVGLTLVVVVLAPLFLASVFTAVTSLGPRRTISVVAAIGTGALMAALLVAWNLGRDEGWRFEGLLGLATLLLSGSAARYALTIPPPSTDPHAVPRHRRVSRRPVLVVNLRSGGGKAEQCELPRHCDELGIEAVVLDRGADLEEVARDAAERGADVLGMAGGDGSLACVARVALEAGIPFVCVPTGTRNHFALDLGLDRRDPTQALGAFVHGEERRVDYATVNGEMFLNNVSLGLYAAMVEQDSYRDAKLETALEMLPKLVEEGGPWFDLHLDVPEHERLEQAAIVQVSNNPYVLAGEFGRRTRLDTGELGVVTADVHRVGDLVGLTLLAAARKPEWSSALWHWTTTSLEIGSHQSELAAGVDGETVALRPPLRFGIEHLGLRVLVPPGTRVGLDEQNLGAKGTYAGLLEVALGLGGADG